MTKSVEMNRFFYFLCFSILSNSQIWAGGMLAGHVRTQAGEPVAGCVVSDGFSVVETNQDGFYQIQAGDSTEFVFVSLPSAYEMPVDPRGLPALYHRVEEGQTVYDFSLRPFADGGEADLHHVMIAISDPQVQDDYGTWRFRHESVADIKEHVASFPSGTPVYGVVVGDLVWDVYDRLPEHTESCLQLGFPVFNVIGNHDHDRNVRQDWGADHYFKENYGPTYYSFNRGKIHYVVLDDIEYTNAAGDKSYSHNIVDYQMEWLRKDLEKTPTSMYVVFLAHAPIEGSKVANRETLYNLVAKRRNTHAITGHHHCLTNYEVKSNFYDHTLGAVMGAFWSGDLCSDGTPNGYGVFQAGSKGIESWYYKSTGYDKSYQMRVYPPNSFMNGESLEDCVIANIWNYDSKWSEVYIYEDGEKHIMYQYNGLDPLASDFLSSEGDERPNYPGSDGGTLASRNPGATSTSHIFYYRPRNPDAKFVVEVTDRNGELHRVEPLHGLMVAAFEESSPDGSLVYSQGFNSFCVCPNQYVSSSKVGKCTYVQGHTPIGWYACSSGNMLPYEGKKSATDWLNFNYLCLSDGSSEQSGLFAYGCGNVADPESMDGNRALGSLAAFQNRAIYYGVMIENTSGKIIDGLDVSYLGEMWRGGIVPSRSQSLSFSYAVNPDILALRRRDKSLGEVETVPWEDLSFFSPVATDAEPNSACMGNSEVNSRRISGRIDVKLYPGDVILLRWEDVDDAGNDNGLAIDDLVVRSASVVDGVTGTFVGKNPSFYNKGTCIYFDEAPQKAVSVYDINGCLMGRYVPTGNVLELSGCLAPGLYLIQTEFGTKKIVLE